MRVDALALMIAGIVLGLAVVLEPSPEVVRLFGWDVPTLCGMRLITGLSCPGCGMTRSFAFLAHGQLRDAFAMNPLGPIAFVVVAAQVPYRSLRLWRGYSGGVRTP